MILETKLLDLLYQLLEVVQLFLRWPPGGS